MLEIGSGLRFENRAKTIKYNKEREGKKGLLIYGVEQPDFTNSVKPEG